MFTPILAAPREIVVARPPKIRPVTYGTYVAPARRLREPESAAWCRTAHPPSGWANGQSASSRPRIAD